MARVRGIGVAVMINWCGWCPPRRALLAQDSGADARRSGAARRRSTRPSEANSTPSWNSACVPIDDAAHGPRAILLSAVLARLARLPAGERARPRSRAARTSGENFARAGRPEAPSAPSVRPGVPSRWRASPPAPPPASCRSRHRPAPGAASASRACKVRLDFREHARLGARRPKRQRREEPCLERAGRPRAASRDPAGCAGAAASARADAPAAPRTRAAAAPGGADRAADRPARRREADARTARLPAMPGSCESASSVGGQPVLEVPRRRSARAPCPDELRGAAPA